MCFKNSLLRLQPLFLVFLFLVLLSSCGRNIDETTLTGKWKVTNFRHQVSGSLAHEPNTGGNPLEDPDDARIVQSIEMEFNDDGETGVVQGISGINSFSADYVIEDDKSIELSNLEFVKLPLYQTAYGEPEIKEHAWEVKFMLSFDRLVFYDYKRKKKLFIYYSNGIERMHLEKK